MYANKNHPELKVDFPNWSDRSKQILKKWRALSTEMKAPYLQKARENRACLKKAQQVSKHFILIKEMDAEIHEEVVYGTWKFIQRVL